MAWYQIRLDRPRATLLGLALLVLGGLGCVFYYTYLNIQHDMDLITAKQKNVFDVFYKRARILRVESISRYMAYHSSLSKPSAPIDVGSDYLYSYDLKSKARFADIPLQYPAANVLNTFRYALSYPEVINIYTVWNDYRLIGMVAKDRVLPAKLASIRTDLMSFGPWYHYFGCASFNQLHRFCSPDEAVVSNIEVDSFSLRNTIAMYFPFISPQEEGEYRYGLLAIDIALDEAFSDVLHPFHGINPTLTAIAFDAALPCRPLHVCLSKPFMHTKTGAVLYLKWSYSWLDFIKLTFHSAAFKVYIIIILLAMVAWKQLYQRLRTLAHTDHLTQLPRRDILNRAMLHEHDYLMILDIDNFKSINDSYGHGIGDQALVAFASHIRSNIRKVDSAIRWGGEEFILLFKGMEDDAMMRHFAARLLARPLTIPTLPEPITFSAGVIRIREYLSVSEAVHLADELLYHVKQQGKHNIACYDGETIRLVRDPDIQQPA